MRLFWEKIAQFLGERIIAYALKHPWTHIEGYMERYWVIPYSRWRWLPAARVHHLLRSDEDRVFHDHPWNYIAIILKGGYFEERPHWDRSGLYLGSKMIWRGPGSILVRPARSWHRLEVPQGGTSWSLFITGRWQQKWGFLISPAYKMRYEEYLDRSRMIEESK